MLTTAKGSPLSRGFYMSGFHQNGAKIITDLMSTSLYTLSAENDQNDWRVTNFNRLLAILPKK